MQVSLHTSALASTAHEVIFAPWLKRVAAQAATSRRLTAVLVPHRADAYYLKSLALSSHTGLWNLRFLTPSDVRNHLAQHLPTARQIPLREHLRLLLATAAERVAAANNTEATASVAAAPDQLLKTIDMIGQAGWDFAMAGPRQLQPIVAEFRRLLADAGFQLVHDADRAALTAARRATPLYRDLFVIGFHASHWSLWPLLEAAVRLAESSTVCLIEPRHEAGDLDSAWIGTWEETFGAAQPIAAESPASLLTEALLLPDSAAARLQRESTPVQEIEFLVGLDTAAQASAIAARALQYLADPACERLGILFPAPGALSRRVATLLAAAAVAHDDGLAYQTPGPLEKDADWEAWQALQENPRVPVLLRFLRARGDAPLAGLSYDEAAYELPRAFQELLIDDLGVLAEYLSRQARERSRNLAAALHTLPLLPERATLGEFIEDTDRIFRECGWIERADSLSGFAADWRDSLDLRVSRRTWLRWLQETLVSWQTRRAEAGSHPYSRLHLLPYAQADSQAWTHLIVAGLNEGQWPPPLDEAGFLGEEEIATLNQQVRTLNTRASVQGSQGEGHVAVHPGRTLCLGPVQKRAIFERQFLNTLESVRAGVTATMQLHDEAAPERPLNPSEFFTRLHFCARGRALSQATLASLQAETARWLGTTSLWKATVPDPDSARQTRVAFDARRAAGRPFGEYEFALRGAPASPLRLAATEWENALAAPAQRFLASVLGVKASNNEEETPWALAQGSWVHRWLSVLTGGAEPRTLTPLPAPTELRDRVRAAAETFRDRVTAALSAQHRPVPDWWQSTWQQADSIATQLAAHISTVQGRTHAATEWSIDNTPLPLETGELYVRGRIDLLLSTTDSLGDVWLVDYKTGKRKALKLTDLALGNGLQLALYALALRAAGAQQVGLSLLAPDAVLDAPQLHLAEVDSLATLWRGLWRIQETGVFGMIGALRDEFGYGQDYPLATLAIDEEILAEKWALSHPDLFAAEDDS
ncbi:MAG: PD-(D/E)XK nuclease family protein [Chthoniobacter sp.]|uniref:PD-(D/E)XK nuclease family protein n=1 Tax=Chthoniobacter sp. TaxID=2510640 RepID=UPI0032A51F1D